MTSSAFSRGSASDSSSPFQRFPHTTVRLSEPGELIASVPAILGFTPTRSVIAICLSGESRPTIGAVMRHDLVFDDSAPGLSLEMRMAVDQFATVSAREAASGVLVLFVDDRFDGTGDTAIRRDAVVDIVEALEDEVNFHGIELLDAFVATRISEGEGWFSLLPDGDLGRQSDPGASRVAMAQVLGGRVIRSSRQELEEILEADPSRETDDIGYLVDAAFDSTTGSRDLPGDPRDPASGHRSELRFVLAHIEQVGSGGTPAPAECAQLALALANVTVRDCLLALAVGDLADDAERLWILLAKKLPAPHRSAPAALLGFSAYVRGDGPLAGIALGSALGADPEHNLARMLDVALQSGIRPGIVRELADVGFECAAALGVDLPTPTDQ